MEVWVATAGAAPFGCPECAAPRLSHDHVEWRWRQLDIIRFRALLCARGPPVRCSTQVVRTTPVLWAESGSRFSLPFERLAIVSTPWSVARRLGLSWDEARGIGTRVVRRGLTRRQPTVVPRLVIKERRLRKHHL